MNDNEKRALVESGDIASLQNEILSELEQEHKRTVCILTPFRNARRYLPLYFSQMSQLQSLLKSHGYRMRIVAAEGDSLDGTRERIVELSREHNIDLTLVDTTHGHMKWASVEDPVRLKVMSGVMNKALNQVKESDDIVVWIMSDLKWEAEELSSWVRHIDYCSSEPWSFTAGAPTKRLDIIAPMVFSDSNKNVFYDTWAFRADGLRFSSQDPFYPAYSESVPRGCSMLPLHSAGSCLIMRGEVARECRAESLEAVSFCNNARQNGYNVNLSVTLHIQHAPLPSRRLLWISDAVCISGFSRVAHALFPQLVEAGYDLDIIALNYFGEPHNFPYPIYPASVQGDDLSGNLRAKYLIYQAHKEDRPYDLIIKLDDPWNFKGLLNSLESLQKECKAKGYEVNIPPVLAWVTVDGENVDGSQLDTSSIEHVASSTDFGTKELWRRGYAGPSSTIPFGVDTSVFQPLDKTEARSLVSSSDIPIDAFIVGVVGTNQQRKRLDLVLAYFSAWVNQYNAQNAYLYLCLGPDDNSGFDINSLKDYYGLKNRIIWNPHLLSDEAMALVYNSFDVYLSLSQGEGFGLTALEAMACGVPCVLSDWSAYSSWVPELVAYKIPCTSTAVSSPLNVQSYVIGGVADQAETIGALQKLYLYPELREKMGKAGVEFAKGMSWRQVGDRLIREIESVLTRVRESPSSMTTSPMMAQVVKQRV